MYARPLQLLSEAYVTSLRPSLNLAVILLLLLGSSYSYVFCLTYKVCTGLYAISFYLAWKRNVSADFDEIWRVWCLVLCLRKLAFESLCCLTVGKTSKVGTVPQTQPLELLAEDVEILSAMSSMACT